MGRGTAQLKCNWFVTEYYLWEDSILTPSLQHTGSKNDAAGWKCDWGRRRQEEERGRIKVRDRPQESYWQADRRYGLSSSGRIKKWGFDEG